MYSTWRVNDLKAELKKRGASLQGRKAELVERLELYDRNFNFGCSSNQIDDDPAMEVPASNTYRDINGSTPLPPLNKTHIRQYFCFADKKLDEKPFVSRPTTHGILNEAVAISEYQSMYDLEVNYL